MRESGRGQRRVENKPPKPSFPERSGWRYGLLLIGLVVLAVLVMDFNSRMADLRRLGAEKEAISARATFSVQTKGALELEIAHATSEAAVLEWAYAEAHMIRPGDKPVVPVQPEEIIPTATPVQIIPQVTPENWQRWFDLFFSPD